MRRKAKLGFCMLMLASVSVLPVRAKVISPGSENVRKSYVNKAAVFSKNGRGYGNPWCGCCCRGFGIACTGGRQKAERRADMKRSKKEGAASQHPFWMMKYYFLELSGVKSEALAVAVSPKRLVTEKVRSRSVPSSCSSVVTDAVTDEVMSFP